MPARLYVDANLLVESKACRIEVVTVGEVCEIRVADLSYAVFITKVIPSLQRLIRVAARWHEVLKEVGIPVRVTFGARPLMMLGAPLDSGHAVGFSTDGRLQVKWLTLLRKLIFNRP